MKIEWQGLVAHVWFDDRDPENAGWYAEYIDQDGTYSDSEKVGEEEMPRRRNAGQKAARLALRALKSEAKRRKQKALDHADRE